MKMWRPDHKVLGPFPAQESDIPQLNRIFAEAFTDRYRRDGMVGVRVPALNPAIWRYALRDAGTGAMIWRDEQNEIVAFNVAHHSGAEGWMGPLAVRPEQQGLGVGGVMVQAAVEWLQGKGVTTIGLETMPRTVDNIGFYSRLRFVPGHLTMTLGGDVTGRQPRERGIRLSQLDDREREEVLAACRMRVQQSAPGYDYTREHSLTNDLEIGDTTVLEKGGVVRAFALWHSVSLAEGRGADEVRVLKLFAESPAAFKALLREVEASAARLSIRKVAVRCQTAFRGSFRALVERGYQVRWTDLRMTLDGYPEAVLAEDEVLFSNWEI